MSCVPHHDISLCPDCGKKTNVIHDFEGRWVCLKCWELANKKRRESIAAETIAAAKGTPATARLISKSFMDERWEFDTREEMETSAKKEARVCGDSVTLYDDRCEIWNFHLGDVRWRGTVSKTALQV